MAFEHSNLICVKRIRGKGRGVFARKSIPCDTLIERVPVLVMPVHAMWETEGNSTLANYVFHWGPGTVALALGYGSLYNHSYQPNARCTDVAPQTKTFRAIRDIEAGNRAGMITIGATYGYLNEGEDPQDWQADPPMAPHFSFALVG